MVQMRKFKCLSTSLFLIKRILCYFIFSAWRIALEQARVAPEHPIGNAPLDAPPPYTEAYPPQQSVVYAYPDTFSDSMAYGAPQYGNSLTNQNPMYN